MWPQNIIVTPSNYTVIVCVPARPSTLPPLSLAVQTRMLFCENAHVLHRFGRPSTRILKTQRLKTHFFENGSQGGKIKNAALPFSCGQRIHIFSKTMTPSPHPSTSYHRPLKPATSHNNNNNNNGGLHAHVHAAEDIEPFLQLTLLVVECELQQQFDLINGPHKRFWFPCNSHFHLLFVFSFSTYSLFVYSAQAYCACSISSSPFLVNVKRHL